MGDGSGFPTRPRAPHRRLHVAQLNPLQTVVGGFACRSAFGRSWPDSVLVITGLCRAALGKLIPTACRVQSTMLP
jgi:hypothetical protein